ncbi:MAG: histidine--tRNA ligase [Chitinophagaceae bacterium]|nr:histidine--tRNA ligase [Chitinophagaceae bacterium]
MAKPSIPRGTRDFGPEVVRKRQYILNIIRNVFELYGFQPLETPAMENIETLMGKYGEEGDKLIFKILNNGLNEDSNKEKASAAFEKALLGKTDKDLTSRALKYDLTIPFARYVAMNHNQLTFPFKRYQIQPVWRADNPQHGRYREFTQCDADVVGSKSLINEVELVNIYHNVFTQLGLKGYQLRINSRKVLAALAESCGGADQMINITIAIDKLDKIGLDGVKKELAERGLQPEQIEKIEKYLAIDGSNDEKLKAIEALLGSFDQGRLGMEELRTVTEAANLQELMIDLTLARGLNYYTGIIFEAKAPAHVKMGSIGGGGRYDDLTGLFGVPNIPGVGISFGVDRIYDVLEQMNLFPPDVQVGTQVLFFNLGDAESKAAYKLMQEMRLAGVRCELFHENLKFDKQFKYAEKKSIPYVVIIGSQELAASEAVIKDLRKSSQVKASFAEAASYVFE